jgi:aconitate hydratase
VSVLSGNRNFEARIHRLIKSNFLCSPALVVAYAIAGNINIDLMRDPIGRAGDGTEIFLRDIWPAAEDVAETAQRTMSREMFLSSYRNVFDGDDRWQSLPVTRGDCFAWDPDSSYIRKPPFVDGDHLTSGLADIHGARVLAVLGDQTTTDHISPVGEISRNSPAGQFLTAQGVATGDFNSYASRRANHDVMARGTFANPRLQNAMVAGVDGPYSRLHPDSEPRFIFDCASTLKAQGTPSIVFAGRQYGTGSARDWAARGPSLLGVKAVVAESFERIHRSNLALMAVLPLELPAGVTCPSLAIAGDETIDILGLSDDMPTPHTITLRITRPDGTAREQPVLCRLDTSIEKAYFRAGGVLRFVFEHATRQAS